MRKNLLSLDIGTSNIHLTVAKTDPFQVLLNLKRPSAGIKKGIIAKNDETVTALDNILEEASSLTNLNIQKSITTVGGSQLETRKSKGVAIIANDNNEITQDDILRAQQSSQSFSLPPNRTLLHTIAQKYVVDGNEVIDNPCGMTGMRLEVESLIIDAFMPNIKNLENVLDGVGLKNEAFVANPLAGSYEALTQQEKNLGAIAIDLGSGTCSFSVFEDGVLVYLKVLPVGSNYISNDICLWLKIAQEDGEKIKLSVGDAYPSKVDKKDMVNLGSFVQNEDKTFSRRELAEVIEARLSQIFEFINEDLKQIGKYAKLPGGAILYGGGAQIPHLVDLAKDRLNLPVRLAKYEEIEMSGESDLSFMNTLGAIKWYGDAANLKESQALGKQGGVMDKFKQFFSNFRP